jgi:peptidoglycan hydrolase-like protein with peptidoglycan-binding domain
MPASFPAGWSAGPVRMGTGFRHQGGSERVREVQRRLWNLGFTPGPVDGLFGPQTRAAVQWFQIKHGLRPDGVVALGTLAVLRARTSVIPAARSVQEPAVREPVRNERAAARGAAPQPQPAAQPADGGQTPAADGGRTAVATIGLVAVALLLLAAPAALALSAVRRHRTRTPKPRRPAATREVAVDPAPQRAAASGPGSAAAPILNGAVAASPTVAAESTRDIAKSPDTLPGPSPKPAAAPSPTAAPAPNGAPLQPPSPEASPAAPVVQGPSTPTAPSPEPLIAIGYVRSTPERTELARHAGAIRRACTSRGWKLAELVRDDQAGGRTLERPGLAAAMERLSGPGRSRLVVSKLAHLSRSATDLRALFEWFGQNDVQVIATDVGIDTTTPEGRQAAHSVLAKVVERQAQARANGNGLTVHATAER